MAYHLVSGIVYALGLTAGVTALSYGDSVTKSPFEKQFSQEFRDGYSILKHYGGNGPYSERRSFGISRDPPESCAVDQVIMIRRHGERYPSPALGEGIEKTLAKLQSSGVEEFKEDLSFYNDWSYYVPNKCYYNAETFSGPYAGLLDAYTHGTEYRDRYGHLLDEDSVVPFWGSGYGRVIATARKFGEGFFGYNYSTNAALNIISESESMGANSLTPSCDTDNDYTTCDNLTNLMPQFKVAATRLNSQNPGLSLNESDVYYLMSMASFELNTRAFSEWINVFIQDEWVSFGYVEDMNYYYCAGLTLLNEGPEKAAPLYLNFAHDTNITPILAALGVLIPDEDLPLDRVPFGSFVRLVLNEAVLPFDKCTSGPGYSCSLEDYASIVSQNLVDYKSTCKIPSSCPQSLDFWWSYNTTTELNYRTTPVACQEGDAMQ
ncbi:acid phosphatase aph 3-phytase phyB [Penicillium cosmopolitanum]|uniref:3-phytase n=1 Tax=Penicillium cosmopolitanum TaxID=1131564 RepID=A0A9W9VNF6_9EURO|nr:acid phosphatase aph 3-phytase phyB [Penicillium cosmopolitanum]KAJ5386378.1 acid phosphatase aph 3-phytase phyB [Penicillium cosmopolitanum]